MEEWFLSIILSQMAESYAKKHSSIDDNYYEYRSLKWM